MSECHDHIEEARKIERDLGRADERRAIAAEIEKLPTFTFTRRGSAGWIRKRDVLEILERASGVNRSY